MKKLLTITALVGLLAFPAAAQSTSTNELVTGPAKDAWSFLTASGTNWMVAPYAIYDSGSKEMGGGLALAYKLSDFVVPTLRVDYLHSQLWMPSADLQLQLPVTIMGKFTAIPFAFAGIATPISGAGDDNGSPVGMFGAGLVVRVSSHWDLVGDVESWQGAQFKGPQYRFGVLYKF